MGWFQKKTPAVPPTDAPKAPAARAAKGLKVSSLLPLEAILFPAAGQTKDTLLQALVGAVCERAGLKDCAPFMSKVLEREKGISTTLDTGLSLPHARMDGIDAVLAGMAVLRTPIPDPSQGDLPIRVMFLFFSPNKQESFPVHLQLLRGVSSLFQPALIDQLTSAAGPAAALELIKKLEA